MAFAYGMGYLLNKSGFVGLPLVNHYGWLLFFIGHKYSPINGPVWQLAILWRHGRTRRHLRHLFPIDGPANSGEPPSWKLMARTPLLCRISDQQSCKFRGAKSSYIFQKSAHLLTNMQLGWCPTWWKQAKAPRSMTIPMTRPAKWLVLYAQRYNSRPISQLLQHIWISRLIRLVAIALNHLIQITRRTNDQC